MVHKGENLCDICYHGKNKHDDRQRILKSTSKGDKPPSDKNLSGGGKSDKPSKSDYDWAKKPSSGGGGGGGDKNTGYNTGPSRHTRQRDPGGGDSSDGDHGVLDGKDDGIGSDYTDSDDDSRTKHGSSKSRPFVFKTDMKNFQKFRDPDNPRMKDPYVFLHEFDDKCGLCSIF